jgi:hypothetical protein
MNARLDEHPVTYLWTEVFKLHDILVVVRVKLQILLTVHFNLQNECVMKLTGIKKGCSFSTLKIFACTQSYWNGIIYNCDESVGTELIDYVLVTLKCSVGH